MQTIFVKINSQIKIIIIKIFKIFYEVLFDIFDLNELNSLSLYDLEFMLISCCSATYKILNKSSDDIGEELIS